jgi:glycopeptide antibiotics resistance protein
MRGLHVTFLGPLGLFVVAAGALSVTVAERRRDPTAGSRLASGVALCATLLAIFALTLVPLPGPRDVQLVPLLEIIGGEPSPPAEILGNIALFVPLGAALCLLGLRRRTTVVAGACLSTLIEFAQLFIGGRTTSVDDVLLNTLGAFLGYVLLARWAPAPTCRIDPPS